MQKAAQKLNLKDGFVVDDASKLLMSLPRQSHRLHNLPPPPITVVVSAEDAQKYLLTAVGPKAD